MENRAGIYGMYLGGGSGISVKADAGRQIRIIKEPGSALTHFIAFVFVMLTTPALLIRASEHGVTRSGMISLSVFLLGSLLLYGASTAYHTFDLGDDGVRRLKKLDHCMIPVLIAASYTPVCVMSLPAETGRWLLTGIWILAVTGVLFKLFFVWCPKWVSSVLYLALGWFSLLALPAILRALPTGAFLLLLGGGILYSVGAVIYALKPTVFRTPHPWFGLHEIFHLFVMGGHFCHLLMMYLYLCA